MGKESRVTYIMVKKAAEGLEAEGIYPSNERVRAITGGGAAIVSTFLRLWRHENETAKLLKSTPLDDGIKVSIFQEIDRHVKLNTIQLQSLLKQEKDSCDAMKNELSNSEQIINSLISEIINIKEAQNKRSLEFEKRITQAETIIEALRSTLNSSSSEIAVAKQRLETSTNEITMLNQNLGKANSDIENKDNLNNSLRNELSVSAVELRASNQKIMELEIQLTKFIGAFENEAETNKNLRNQLSEVTGELRLSNQKNSEVERQSGKLEEQILHLGLQLVEIRKEATLLKNALNAAEKNSAIAKTRLSKIKDPSLKKK
jgi:DNA repair exonuclease SbcCD ATPase subunit